MALKHASIVILYASGLDVLCGLVPQWLRTRYRLLFSLRVGAHFPLEQLWAISGVSWVLPEHLREALGSSREALGSVLGCFWGVLGSLLGLRESFGSGNDAKVKITVYLRNSLVLEVPVAPKASQHRPGVASRGLVERAKVASSVFGRVASRKVAPKRRNSAEPSGPQRKSAAA